jgi:peptidase M28-like protein
MSTAEEQGKGIAGAVERPDPDWLRELLAELEQIHRPSASEGELRAARWLVKRLGRLGAAARIEIESAHGTYWWPLGVGAAIGVAAGVAGSRGRRLRGAVAGLVAGALIADEFPPGKRRLRGVLPQRETSNVVCEVGPEDAERTVVVIAHHDAARSGLIFHPAIPQIADRAGLIERSNTSPMLMAPVVGGPVLTGLGSLLGSRFLLRLGTILSAGTVAAMAEIGSRDTVPGANDNGTAVVSLIALAKRFLAEPTQKTRVILLSAGSEESFSEGIKAFGERHFDSLPRESTFFLCLETTGSPHLTVLRGEGFLKMWEYPQPALDLIDGLAEELGIWLFPNLRLHNGTDGLEPLAAGYPTVALCSCTDLKQPANYHWPSDVAENVNYETVADGVQLAEAVIRRLDERWL